MSPFVTRRPLVTIFHIAEDNAYVCADCASDARDGGARPQSVRVPADLWECSFCKEIIR